LTEGSLDRDRPERRSADTISAAARRTAEAINAGPNARSAKSQLKLPSPLSTELV
jgi:hypothetical protein